MGKTTRAGAMVLAAVLAGAVLGGQGASAGERQEQGGTAVPASGGSLFTYDWSTGSAGLMRLDSPSRVGLTTTTTTTYSAGYSQVASGEFLSEGRGSGVVLHDPEDGRWAVLEARGPDVRPRPLASGRFSTGYDRIQVVEAPGGWYLLMVRWGDPDRGPSWSLLSLDPDDGVPRLASTGRALPDLVSITPDGAGGVVVLQYDGVNPGTPWARWGIDGTGTAARVVETGPIGRLAGLYFDVETVETDGDLTTRELFLAPSGPEDPWAVVRLDGQRLRPVGTGVLAPNVAPWQGLDVLGRPADGVTPLVSWTGDEGSGRGLRWSGPGSLAPTVVSRATHPVDAGVWVLHPTR